MVRSRAQDDAPEIEAEDEAAFDSWMTANGADADGVWLVYWKKGSGRPSIDWDGAVRVALCWGWIDSKVQTIDEHRHRQWFSPRKPGGTWSQVNKERIAELEAEGRMQPSGRAAIDAARADGSWDRLELSDALVEPEELAAALDADPKARDGYDAWPTGVRRGALFQIYDAKRPATRARRVAAVVDAAAAGARPFGL